MGPLCMYARQCPLTLKHHTGGLFCFQVSENPSNRNAPFLFIIKAQCIHEYASLYQHINSIKTHLSLQITSIYFIHSKKAF